MQLMMFHIWRYISDPLRESNVPDCRAWQIWILVIAIILIVALKYYCKEICSIRDCDGLLFSFILSSFCCIASVDFYQKSTFKTFEIQFPSPVLKLHFLYIGGSDHYSLWLWTCDDVYNLPI